MKCSRNRTRRNSKWSCVSVPVAFTATTTVTNCPLSDEVMAPTYFTPFPQYGLAFSQLRHLFRHHYMLRMA